MPQIKASLAIVQSFLLLLLIVSCLLGSQTCWWPLNSQAPCGCGHAMQCGRCVRMCHVHVQRTHKLNLCSVKLWYFRLFLPLIICPRAEKWSFVRLLCSRSALLLSSLSLTFFLLFFVDSLHSSSWLSVAQRMQKTERFSNCFSHFLIAKTSAVCCSCVTLLTAAGRVSN